MNQNITNHNAPEMTTNKTHIRRILYATDLTQSSPKVYQYVLYLAQQFNAEVICVNVIDKYSDDEKLTFKTYLTKEMQQEIRLRETKKSLDEMTRRNRQSFIRQQLGLEDGLCPDQLGLSITDKVVHGNIEEQILKTSVAMECDLIVMGAHEKPYFTFTTTLSKRVMKRSKVPVTVVPLPGERRKQSKWFLPFFSPQLRSQI